MPCASVMQTQKWDGLGDGKIQDKAPIVQGSTIKCNYGGIDIKITDSGQREEINNVIDSSLLPTFNKLVPDFGMTLSLNNDRKNKTVVPLGIPDFNGKEENAFFVFDYELLRNEIDSFTFEVFDDKGEMIYTFSHEPTEIETSMDVLISPRDVDDKGEIPEGNIYASDIEYCDYTQVGKYQIKWDGFDQNGIYDSTRFRNKVLNARVTGQKGSAIKIVETNFHTIFSKAIQWVDVKIDKNTNRIDTTLRVNFKDGGERGIHPEKNILTGELEKPWSKIPQEVIRENKPIITIRSKSYENLVSLALEGIQRYWGRNSENGINVGNNIKVKDKNYEFFINPINTTFMSMSSIPLIYNTNNDWMRSGNPGGSNFDKIFPDMGIIKRLTYNAGYIKYLKGWGYQMEYLENIEYKETAAHEIGHEILLECYGTVYSWQHKGSTYYLNQDAKATQDSSRLIKLKESLTHLNYVTSEGEYYPNGENEIDLMKYYHEKYDNDILISAADVSRTVAATADVCALISLTKLKIG